MGAQRFVKSMLLLVALILVATIFFRNSMGGGRSSKDLTYGEFYQNLVTKKIDEVTITDNDAAFKLKGDTNTTYNVSLPPRDRNNLNAALDKASLPAPEGNGLKVKYDRP
ncbi:MAG: ATP-dependent metallopeptidase FtsH/Yme1/Tma family protein, partial [Abitibacteriaceae bacterium]|nr:ATP-dependent metallopeptidase FtsH/Yme1/Tma family protein [Abditibacteriaceae bacterium]